LLIEQYTFEIFINEAPAIDARPPTPSTLTFVVAAPNLLICDYHRREL
jgi:hypothetical protein